MTPDKNFRMKSTTKTLLAVGNFRNVEDRNQFKRMMIQAQLAEEAARRAAFKAKGDRQKDAE
jgi:hypothetical protein